MKFLLLLMIATCAVAQDIHSSIFTYFESKKFENSKQKLNTKLYGVGADIHLNSSKYRFAYEYAYTHTKQPPLKKDLKVNKLFARYIYMLSKDFEINLNYIDILHDNIAITDKGRAYGCGIGYDIKKIHFNYTQFFTNYNDFNIYQSDFHIIYKIKLHNYFLKIESITKYISIDEKHKNSFTKNANREYLSSGMKLHLHHNIYHFGTGIYIGKRAFAIMQEGFKIQHHAMEFKETYAIGAGITVSDFIIRVQYTTQKAQELPSLNKNVIVKNTKMIINYKF